MSQSLHTNAPNAKTITGTSIGNKHALDVSEIGRDTNSIGVAQTSVTTIPIAINTPEGCNTILCKHLSTGNYVWIGNNRNIAHNTTDVYPIAAGEVISLDINPNQENELYVVSESASITFYAIGGLKDV